MVNWLARMQARPLGGKSLEELKRVQAEKVLSDLALEILRLGEGSRGPNAAEIEVPPLAAAAVANSRAVVPREVREHLSALRQVSANLEAARAPTGAGIGQRDLQANSTKPEEAPAPSAESLPARGGLAFPPPSGRSPTSTPEPVGTGTQPDPAARYKNDWHHKRRSIYWLLSWLVASAIGYIFAPPTAGYIITASAPWGPRNFWVLVLASSIEIALSGILQWVVIVVFFRRSLSVLRSTAWIAVIVACATAHGYLQWYLRLRLLSEEILWIALQTLALLLGRIATFPDQRNFSQFRSLRILFLILPFALFLSARKLVEPWEKVLVVLGYVSMMLPPAVELLHSLPRPEAQT
jgi:hypothetical protein